MWCAVVGLPAFGVRAAAEAGLDPGRLLLVPAPGRDWPQVTATLLDGCDLVMLRVPASRRTAAPPPSLRRKLEATVRRHRGVLLIAGEWPGATLRLRVAGQDWAGIGAGHGRLRARRALVEVIGRGAAERPRSGWLWLPGPDGTVSTAPAPGIPAAGTPVTVALAARTPAAGTPVTVAPAAALAASALAASALAASALAASAVAGAAALAGAR